MQFFSEIVIRQIIYSKIAFEVFNYLHLNYIQPEDRNIIGTISFVCKSIQDEYMSNGSMTPHSVKCFLKCLKNLKFFLKIVNF